jgi:hypothetical protein
MKSANSPEELRQLWADPQHWTTAGLYRCESDPRLWVLKRGQGIGYTINIAHQRSVLLFLGILVVALAPTAVSLGMGRSAPSWLILVQLLVPISIVVILLVWLSRRPRD